MRFSHLFLILHSILNLCDLLWVMNTIIIYLNLETIYLLLLIVSAARSLTCRDDLDSKWRLLLAENELSCVSLLSSISIGN